ncbi:MAG: VOC family protein [Pseudomonadota bacterium]
MQRVTGIGGFFFRAQAPEVLAVWYRDMLGIDLVPQAADQQPWHTVGGPVVFAPFAADTGYFSADRAFMLNFKVDDMDAMIAQLRENGIEAKERDPMPGIGRFAHLHDPEGTPIELWQPEG